MPIALSRKSSLIMAAVLVLAATGALLVRWLGEHEDPALCAALAEQRLVRVYLASGATLSCPGVSTAAPSAAMQATLQGTDPAPLARLLAAEKGAALAASKGGATSSLLAQLARLQPLPGLRSVALAPGLVVLAPAHEIALSLTERDALAYVARALLRGAREPNLASFPPALRQVERVEVLVLLRERGEPRLWRSARGTSIARALLTATRVARERWHERESAMGGSLVRRLLDLDVEVSLLAEDGVLLDHGGAFVDRAISPQHGVGFEYKSGWHYLLPEDVARRGHGSPFRALTALLDDQGLTPGQLAQRTLRVYRFVALALGASSAPLGAAGSAGAATPG